MPYTNNTPPVFTINDTNNWKDYLLENGFVVIKDILNIDEKALFWNLFKTDFKYVSPDFDFNDKTTWTIKNYPGMFGKGICPYNGLGQSNFSWFIRTNPKIKEIYSKLFDTDDLITSIDAFSLFFTKKQKSKSWHHIDQNPKNKLTCYQGAYNYFKVGENDAGFVVAPGSHKLFNPKVKHKNNWIMVPDDSEWHSKVVKILIPHNCFTLWNSRTIHANTGMLKNTIEFNRLTIYVTLMPREYSNGENRQKKIEAYKNGDTCSHWANKCVIKRYPFGFKKQHELKNLCKLLPYLENNCIPEQRKKML